MADLIYNRGLDEMAAWTTSTYKFLLLKGSGYTPNRDHDFVSDLTPASNEVSAAGYSRVTASTKIRTIDDSGDRITYDCDDPSFGTLTTGQTVSGMVLFRFVSSDSDSILIALYDFADVDSAAISPFAATLSTQGVFYYDQGA